MRRGGILRSSVFLLIFSLFGLSAGAHVLVFQSGKVVPGRVLFEDTATIRFEDETGVAMTVKKSLLDIDATRLRNRSEAFTQPAEQSEKKMGRPTTLAEVAKLNLATRTMARRTFTNADISYGPAAPATRGNALHLPDLSTVSESELEKRLQKAEQGYDRLKSQCRAAGGGGASVRHVATYMVDGKKVTVEGNWADPAAVSQAKQICARALQSQQELGHIQDELQRRHDTSSYDAPVPASR